ncbi:MAG: flippase-like domain-containing protein, partial [Proteobacteria bacterium]|nr:flippase-like domain-containing protein [Pseudomonadota bacterium]
FELYMVGTFFNLFMPGTVGGDVIKAYYLYKGTQKKGDSLVSVFMERYMGMLALILISTTATIIGYQYIKGTFAFKFFIMIVIAFISGTIFVSFFPYEIFYKKLKGVRVAIRDFIFHRDIFIKTLCLSLIVQGIGVFVVFLLAKAINIDIPLSYHFIFIPIISVISMIPVSFSGVGLREYSFLHFYSLAGVNEEKAVTLSLLWFVIMIITGLIGVIFYLKLGSGKTDKNAYHR